MTNTGYAGVRVSESFAGDYAKSAARGKKAASLIGSFTKRSFDIIAAAVSLIVLAAPFMLISLAIILDSRGPVIFRQRRVGRGGKEFYIYKFRTMYTSAPSMVASGELDRAKSYITRVGGFLRKTSLDELPQLINVLRGDMSVVGPRPLIINESEIHNRRMAAGIYSVRPGVTGWAQVNGRDEITLDEKIRYDTYYISNKSMMFDARILLKTVWVVLSKSGYAEGSRR